MVIPGGAQQTLRTLRIIWQLPHGSLFLGRVWLYLFGHFWTLDSKRAFGEACGGFGGPWEVVGRPQVIFETPWEALRELLGGPWEVLGGLRGSREVQMGSFGRDFDGFLEIWGFPGPLDDKITDLLYSLC